MNTLHMYHWRNIESLENNLSLMGSQDTLVIYGHLSDQDINEISTKITGIPHPWYIVNTDHKPHNKEKYINNKQWLDLIIKHRKTLAWK